MTRFDDLITPEVYQVALNYADRLARRTRNGLEAIDLVQEALTNIADHYEGRYEEIRDLGALLTTAIQNEYLIWIRTQGVTGRSRRDVHLATGSLTDYLDPVDENGQPCESKGAVPHQLRTLPRTDHTIRVHDVETAISKLPPKDQKFVRLYLTTEGLDEHYNKLSIRQLAVKMGVTHPTLLPRWHRIRRRLAVLLADYAPVGRADRTSHEKSA